MTGSSGMGTGSSRKETERVKLIQEKCHTLLSQMLRDEDNKYCVDCDAKGELEELSAIYFYSNHIL